MAKNRCAFFHNTQFFSYIFLNKAEEKQKNETKHEYIFIQTEFIDQNRCLIFRKYVN